MGILDWFKRREAPVRQGARPVGEWAFKTMPVGIGERAAAPLSSHYLTVVQGATARRFVPITVEPLVLGRDAGRPFHLSDPQVSRDHCEVRLVGFEVRVRDLGSTNGTFVDGAAVTRERSLPPASLLQVGRHTLRHELLTPEEVDRQERQAFELERAGRYVLGLIPPAVEAGALRVEWCFVPSSVLGGDALGYHRLEDGRMAVYVLDVCGHGVDSAMHAASVLNVLRSGNLPATDFGSPAQVLDRLNGLFAMEDHGQMYFTLWYGVIDERARRLRYAVGGHPPALLLDERGAIRARLGSKRLPLGTFPSLSYSETEVEFREGERLYVFSDGAFEITDRQGRDRGLEDLVREVEALGPAAPAGTARRLYETARATAGAPLLEDDFSMLVVSCTSSER